MKAQRNRYSQRFSNHQKSLLLIFFFYFQFQFPVQSYHTYTYNIQFQFKSERKKKPSKNKRKIRRFQLLDTLKIQTTFTMFDVQL